MFKGVEWHKHVIKVTETLPNPQLLHMRIALTFQKLTNEVKTNECCFYPAKQNIDCFSLPLFMGLQRRSLQRSRVKEKAEYGPYCAGVVHTFGRGGASVSSTSGVANEHKVKLLLVLKMHRMRIVVVCYRVFNCVTQMLFTNKYIFEMRVMFYIYIPSVHEFS